MLAYLLCTGGFWVGKPTMRATMYMPKLMNATITLAFIVPLQRLKRIPPTLAVIANTTDRITTFLGRVAR